MPQNINSFHLVICDMGEKVVDIYKSSSGNIIGSSSDNPLPVPRVGDHLRLRLFAQEFRVERVVYDYRYMGAIRVLVFIDLPTITNEGE